MQIFDYTIPISFNYAAFDEESALFVRATIYDVTSGTPSLVTTVDMEVIEYGFYSGNFTGEAEKIYLIIALCYTDDTYTTINTDRSPSAEIYKDSKAPLTSVGVVYGTYDFNDGLYIASDIYETTSGTPVFVENVVMEHVLGGIYYGPFTGTGLSVYQAIKLVYQDNTYADVDPNYSPGTDSFQLAIFGGGTVSVGDIISALPNAVWNAPLVNHTTTGTFGAFVQKLLTVGKFLGLQ